MLQFVFKSLCFRVTRRRRRFGVISLQVTPCEQRVLLSAVDVTTSPGPAGSVKVNFEGTESDDQVLLGTHYLTGLLTAYSFNGTTFRLNGGPEVSEVTFNTISDATFDLKGGSDYVSVFLTSIRDMNLDLGPGDDTAFIIDANVRDLKILDGVGDFEQNAYWIQNFASSFQLRNIEAEFDRGISQLNVNAYSQQTIEVGKVEILGHNVQSVGFAIAADQNSHVIVNGHVELTINPASFGVANLSLGTQSTLPGDSATVELRKSIELHAPGGMLTVNGNTRVDGETEFVTTGFSNDRFSIESGAPVFNGQVNISTGDGDDFILWEKFDAAASATQFNKAVSISTGEGNDIVNIGPAVFAKSLDVDLGSSNPFGPFGVDNMRLGAVDVSGKLGVRSTGEATIVIDPPATGQTRFRKDASFTLGAGRVYVDSSDSNVIFDKSQDFTGNPNRIQVFFIGNVIANPAKRTLTNADLFAS